MAEQILLTFLSEQVSARAVLLTERAPSTCSALIQHLPLRTRAHHAIYSGSEIALVMPDIVREDPENATWEVAPGDIGYAWFSQGSHYGVLEDFSELCWFYDFDARPSLWEGPVAVSVFAHLIDADLFYAVCRRIRIEGAKTIEITLSEARCRQGPPIAGGCA